MIFDHWDIGALLAIAVVLAGLSFWHWPAALVAGGAGFLWLYIRREKALAAKSASRRR